VTKPVEEKDGNKDSPRSDKKEGHAPSVVLEVKRREEV